MLEQGYNKIYWGFIMTIFNINVGPLRIFPDFIGYFVICLGFLKIQKEYQNNNFKIAIIFTNILLFYSIIVFIMEFIGFGNFIGINIERYHYKNIIETGFALLQSLINLLMIFYILSGTIDMFIGLKLDTQANNIVSSQKTYVILYIIGLILLSISINITSEKYYIVVVIYIFIIEFNFATIINDIRKIVKE
jgi:hypothetical protein